MFLMEEGKIIVKHSFVPMRVLEKSGSSVDIIFDVYNNTDKEVLLSFDFKLPKKALIGFDPTATKKETTVKLKKIPPFEKTSFYITIYTTSQTPAYDYPILYYINYHVDDYSKVLERKTGKCYLKVV